MFFADIMSHLQALDLSLQGKGKIVSDFAQAIFSFQKKIKLFQGDINTKSLRLFPLSKGLANSENDLCSEKIKVYVEKLEGVSTNSATWFSDLEILNPTLLFFNPFVFSVVKNGCMHCIQWFEHFPRRKAFQAVFYIGMEGRSLNSTPR